MGEEIPTQPKMDSTALRQRAEEVMRRLGASPNIPHAEDLATLLQELTIHQIELEMQGEELRHSLEALGHAKALYFRHFEAAPVPILRCAQDGAVIEMNLAAADLLGVRRSGTKDRPHHLVERLLEPGDGGRWKTLLADAIRGPGAVRQDLRLRGGKGEQFVFAVTALALRETPEPQVLMFFQDDTAERRRREEFERLAMLASGTDNVVTFTNARRQITWVNAAFTRVTGYTPEEAMGKNPSFLQGEKTDQETVRRIREGLNAGRRVVEEILNYTKDGREYTIALEITPLRNSNGMLTGYMAIERDVTQRNLAQVALRRSEKELREAKELYRMLLENSTDVVLQLSDDDTIVWATPAVTKLLGWLPGQVVGRKLEDYVHSEDQDSLRPVQANLALGITAQLEMRVRLAGGGYRWVSATIRPIFDKQGVVTGRVAGLRDIQAEIVSRETVEVERKRLRATLDSLLDPHVVLRPIRDGNGKISDFVFSDANPAACIYYRMDRNNLVGANLLSLLPAQRSSGLFEKYCETIESGHPLVLRSFPYHDETPGAPERRMDLSGAKIDDALGLTWRDVTDQYLAASKLAKSEEHYRLLSRSLYDTVMRTNDAGVVTWISPSIKPLLGYEPEEWVGQSALDFLVPEDAPGARANIERVMRGESVVARYAARDKQGALRRVDSYATGFFDSQGHRDGLVVSFHLADGQSARN